MKGKRFLIHWCGGVLLALLLCAVLPGRAEAATYSDTAGHWAEPAIERWSDSGILQGYTDGRFGPDDPMTRAQLAAVLYRIWGCSPKEGLTYEDLKPGAWYYDALTTMERYEIALGRGDHIYPDENLTREEAFYMVGRAFMFSDGEDAEPRDIEGISDGTEISVPYFYCIRTMFRKGALHGSSDGKFHPKDLATRAQVMTVIDNIFDLCINEPGEYSVTTDQVILVRCGGVKLTYSGKRMGGDYRATVYTMAGVGPKGVEIVRDSNKSLRVDLKGVKECEERPWLQDYSDHECHVTEQEYLRDLNGGAMNRHIRFAGGIGTPTYPYRIETLEQLMGLSSLPYNFFERDKMFYIELCNDITLPNQAPIGSPYVKVSLDGKDHTITVNMEGEYPYDKFHFGVFEYLYGEISNLNLAGKMDVTILDGETEKEYVERYAGRSTFEVGALAGTVNGNLTNCTSSVDITVRYGEKLAGALTIGGLVGDMSEQFTNCSYTGKLNVICTGDEMQYLYVGGLAGDMTGQVTNCAFAGDMTITVEGEKLQDIDAGGLVGQLSGQKTEWGKVTDSTAVGTMAVKAKAPNVTVYAGGLAGATKFEKIGKLSAEEYQEQLETGVVKPLTREDFSQGVKITGCGSTTEMTLNGGWSVYAGGLVGISTCHPETPLDIAPEEFGGVENSWSTATITAKGMSFEGDCGGLVGHHWAGLVRSCWAKPTITIQDGYYHNMGGIVGKAVGLGAVSDCWTEISGLNARAAGESKSGSYHYGGIMGRQDTDLKNCFVLGNRQLAPRNAITYEAWSFAEVTGCMDMTGSTASAREKFYKTCGWDFETVWDKSGIYPILRGCDPDAQRAAQGVRTIKQGQDRVAAHLP